MRRRSWLRDRVVGSSLCALALGAGMSCARAEDWLPVAPDDLKMTSEPKAPGAAAIILYRQVDRDDNGPSESNYVRIKILTDEGRKFGNVEIPFFKQDQDIRGIRARTIRPDGSVVNFDGAVYEKTILSQGRGKLLAKTFSLPAVEVGGIIEYRYRNEMASGYVFDSHWILSQALFTRYAKFSLQPSGFFALTWSWPLGLPEGASDLPKMVNHHIRLEVRDVPAFVTEDYMPPENELKFRVDFIYAPDSQVEADPDKFWKRYGKIADKVVEDFVDKRRAMEQALTQIVQPGDSAEVKLRKIYARTQQIRNTSFERQKTQQELEHDNDKDARHVDEVWDHGYGDGIQISWLFMALARAAGMDAQPVLLPTRDEYFFNIKTLNARQLNSNAVLVNLNGKQLYLDPGTPYTPFGILPWAETAVHALRLDKDGGSWVTTPLPAETESRVERAAALKLARNGTVQGKLTVTYTGLEAQWRRISERNQDDTERKQFLEDEVKADVASGIDITLVNQPDWNSSAPTLVAEFDLAVPGWMTAAGNRALLPATLFEGDETRSFGHAARVQPVYFHFPYQHKDDVTIDLPDGWQVGNLPAPRANDIRIAGYSIDVQRDNQRIHLARSLTLYTQLVKARDYPPLRDFFQEVKVADAESIILLPGPSAGPGATVGPARH